MLYRPSLCGSFIPEGYIPIMEAASLLAFDDREFLNYTLETRFNPKIGEELLGPKEDCPEIDHELHRLVDKHTAREIIIIGRRRGVPEWRNQIREPDPRKREVCNKYEAIPSDYFSFNDWVFSWLDPFGITIKGGDPFGAEWFYPAVALRDVYRLRAES